MTEAELEQRGEAARRLAVQAGDMLARQRAEAADMAYESKGLNDIVTKMDRACEDFLVEELHRAFPDDDIHAEEGGLRRHAGTGCWIIDPIDGTENYVRGIPAYAVSIAFEENRGRPDVGVVYCPPAGELYWAVRGSGAWLNDARIRVSDRSAPADAVSAVSPPFRLHQYAEEYFALYRNVFAATRDVRNTGSAALHTCYVAAGRVDGYFENGVHSYDIAAGLIIAEEAGGRWSSLFCGDHPYDSQEILVTNGLLHNWYRLQAQAVRRR